MLAQWQKFHRLPRSAQVLFIQALWALAIAAIAIRLFSFKRIQAALRSGAPMSDAFKRPWADNCEAVRITARMARAAAQRLPFQSNCLCQSLVLWWLLRRQGIPGDLRIGVRKREGRLEAHAWVEWSGNALNDSGDGYEPFAAFHGPIIGAEVELK